MSNSVRPRRQQPTRLPRPWGSPGKNTGMGCHFLLQCMKVKSEREDAQSYPTLSDPMDCSLPGSSESTGVGSNSLLQGIFPPQGSNPGLLHCRQILYHLSHQVPHLKLFLSHPEWLLRVLTDGKHRKIHSELLQTIPPETSTWKQSLSYQASFARGVPTAYNPICILGLVSEVFMLLRFFGFCLICSPPLIKND